MDKVMIYPELRSFILTNLYVLLFTIVLIIALFGWAGLLGIVGLILSILIQIIFNKPLGRIEEELSRKGSARVQKTIDYLGIIKYIKVAALEMPYFKKLVNLREAELVVFHKKVKLKTIPIMFVTVAIRFVILIVCVMLIS